MSSSKYLSTLFFCVKVIVEKSFLGKGFLSKYSILRVSYESIKQHSFLFDVFLFVCSFFFFKTFSSISSGSHHFMELIYFHFNYELEPLESARDKFSSI